MFSIQFVLKALIFELLNAKASALSVPENVQGFYDSVRDRGECTNKLATGFYSTDDGPDSFSYCGDQLCDYNIVYLQGDGAALANMDIDCDGRQNTTADDGRCGHSVDTQAITSFRDTLDSYDRGLFDLDANIHSFVVFGNVGSKQGWETFYPRDHGIEPLSVMAVVCNDQLFYGVWGDENGDDGDHPLVGEASIALATACFGEDMNGNNGHEDTDVLYIAFPGEDAVPGALGANWSATSFDKFHDSIRGLGDRLIQRIPSGQDHSLCSGQSARTDISRHWPAAVVSVSIFWIIV